MYLSTARAADLFFNQLDTSSSTYEVLYGTQSDAGKANTPTCTTPGNPAASRCGFGRVAQATLTAFAGRKHDSRWVPSPYSV